MSAQVLQERGAACAEGAKRGRKMGCVPGVRHCQETGKCRFLASGCEAASQARQRRHSSATTARERKKKFTECAELWCGPNPNPNAQMHGAACLSMCMNSAGCRGGCGLWAEHAVFKRTDIRSGLLRPARVTCLIMQCVAAGYSPGQSETLDV